MAAAMKRPRSNPAPALYTAFVVAGAAGAFVLDDGARARTAASCLLAPQCHDRVLVAADGTTCFILAVLERESGGEARLQVDGASRVTLAAPTLGLRATEAVHVQSLREVEVTAVGGDMRLAARNLIMSAAESLIQNVKHYVAHVGTYALQARTLLRLHGEHALVTARRDVKVDADRISLG